MAIHQLHKCQRGVLGLRANVLVADVASVSPVRDLVAKKVGGNASKQSNRNIKPPNAIAVL